MVEGSVEPAGVSIGAAARRAGLSPHVLRAWERRYGAVSPGRGAGGRRVYSGAEVERLRLLRLATQAGHAIGQVAARSTAELRELVREREAAAIARTGPGAGAARRARWVAECRAGAAELDAGRVHAALRGALVALGSGRFVERVVLPLAEEAEAETPAGRVLAGGVRQVLGWILGAMPGAPEAPVLVAAAPAGERRELGAMLAGVVAAEEGYRVAQLGAELAAAEIAAAAGRLAAEVVALGVRGSGAGEAWEEAAHLRRLLPGGVELVAVGREAGEGGAGPGEIPRVDLGGLRALLRARRGPAHRLQRGRADG